MSETTVLECDVCGREGRWSEWGDLPDGWCSALREGGYDEEEDRYHFCSDACRNAYWAARDAYRQAWDDYTARRVERIRLQREWDAANPEPVFVMPHLPQAEADEEATQ